MKRGKGMKAYASKLVPFLNTVKGVKKNNRSVLMEHLSDDSVDLLFDTIRNVIKSNAVSPTQKGVLKKKLARHKSTLRYLSDSSKPIKARRRRMMQTGKGGIPYLDTIISTALPLLMAMI